MEMNRSLIEQFQQTVSEIYCNYVNNDVLMAKEERHLPSRNTIIQIIKELRRVIFPGYFGDENLSDYIGDYFVGSLMNRVYHNLKKQIVLALTYSDEGIAIEEAEKKAEDISCHFIS